MGTVTYPTLEHVAMQARPYPTHLLSGASTGLCLFAAGFLGHNDAIHMAEAGMRVVCVDTDRLRLNEMRGLYPGEWRFVEADAWEFAGSQYVSTYDQWVQWDVVSVDTFTGEAMHRSLDSLDLWCSLARCAVTCTLTVDATYTVPDGWTDSLFLRSGSVYWLCLERDA